MAVPGGTERVVIRLFPKDLDVAAGVDEGGLEAAFLLEDLGCFFHGVALCHSSQVDLGPRHEGKGARCFVDPDAGTFGEGESVSNFSSGGHGLFLSIVVPDLDDGS